MAARRTSAGASDNPRSASALDRRIGRRLREARRLSSMSQTALADHVGVTFQQVQKYERGTNRVPASRLYEFARALDRPLGYFFADHDSAAKDSASAASALSRLRRLDKARAGGLQTVLEACPPEIRDDLLLLVSSADAFEGGSGT